MNDARICLNKHRGVQTSLGSALIQVRRGAYLKKHGILLLRFPLKHETPTDYQLNHSVKHCHATQLPQFPLCIL